MANRKSRGKGRAIPKRKPTEEEGRTRLRAGLVVMLTMLGILGGSLIHIQGVDPEGVAADAVASRTRTKTIEPNRGSVFDRNGTVLAMSLQRYDIVIDQTLFKEFKRRDANDRKIVHTVSTEQAISELSKIIDLDPSVLRPAMTGTKRWAVVAKNLTPEQRNQVSELRIPGIDFEQKSERKYPNGAVAGTVLGFLNSEGRGIDGLELSFDEELKGQPGERTYEISADGVRIPQGIFKEKPAVEGANIRLTLDTDVQWMAQEAVESKQKQFRAEWVNAVVMEVETGNIVAMADSSSVDPNEPADSKPEDRVTKGTTGAVEPGSTGKLITFAAAYEEGTYQPTEAMRIPNSYITSNGQKINDSLKHPTFNMTAAGVFTRSYNTGTVMIGERISHEKRYEYMKKVGIGDKIDIGLPSSNTGIFAAPAAWDGRQRYTTMFGQGYTVTPLHTARVFQTVANNGVMMQPRLIDATLDEEGNETPYKQAEPVRVFSEKTSDEMLKLMEGVVENGTAYAAKLDGYRVGGKTGTAQAAGANGVYDGHTSSFAGVAPLDNPKYVVVVTMHRPKGHWRDWSVTDTFAKIMKYTLQRNQIPPSSSKSEAYDSFIGENQQMPWE